MNRSVESRRGRPAFVADPFVAMAVVIAVVVSVAVVHVDHLMRGVGGQGEQEPRDWECFDYPGNQGFHGPPPCNAQAHDLRLRPQRIIPQLQKPERLGLPPALHSVLRVIDHPDVPIRIRIDRDDTVRVAV